MEDGHKYIGSLKEIDKTTIHEEDITMPLFKTI